MTLSLQIRYTDAETDGVECTYQQVDYIISKLRNDGWILISYSWQSEEEANDGIRGIELRFDRGAAPRA